MKILFALPGHLKTVPMGTYSVDALRSLGHEVAPFEFQPTWRDRLAMACLAPGVDLRALNN